MKTKAAVLYEHNADIPIEELDIPLLKEGQALINVEYAGLCHSNLNQWKGIHGPDKNLPRLFGHEGSGTVMEVGKGVTKVKPEDKVILSWIQGSGAQVKNCTYAGPRGEVNSGAISTFADYVVVSENRVTPLSFATPPERAALIGCAVPTGMGMIYNLLEEKPGESIAIYGMGGVGMSALLAATEVRYEPRIAVDVHPNKLERALSFGATHAINALEENVVERVRELTEGKGTSYAIESSGNTQTMEYAFDALADHGKMVLSGNAPKGSSITLPVKYFNHGKKLLGTWGGDTSPDRDFPRYELLSSKGTLPIDKLISDTYALEDINQAISDLQYGDPCRVLIKP